MYKFKYLFILFFCCAALNLAAQDDDPKQIKVTDFKLLETDLDAKKNREGKTDQNGDLCAIIKVQTIEKGLLFDAGSIGVSHVIEDKPGEVWVYVPYGSRSVIIRHPKMLASDEFRYPISIESGRVYQMKIWTPDIAPIVGPDEEVYGEDTVTLNISVNPVTAYIVLNDLLDIKLDSTGKSVQRLRSGSYRYKVVAPGYYPYDSKIILKDSVNNLIIDRMEPILGVVILQSNVKDAKVQIDGKSITDGIIGKPYELQVGKHEITLERLGYRSVSQTIEVKEKEFTEPFIEMTQEADFSITSKPSGAYITINGEAVGTTPCKKVLITDTYTVKATKKKYRTFEDTLHFNSSNPFVELKLKRFFNWKNEFYIEGGARIGSLMAYGGTMGFYLGGFNIEGSYFMSSDESEEIYWNGTGSRPVPCTYTPGMVVSAKIGIAIRAGLRFRFTPQAGIYLVKAKENSTSSQLIADGANVASAVGSLRISFAIAKNFGLSVTPEFLVPVMESEGYTALKEVSPIMKTWGEGFNLKAGIYVCF